MEEKTQQIFTISAYFKGKENYYEGENAAQCTCIWILFVSLLNKTLLIITSFVFILIPYECYWVLQSIHVIKQLLTLIFVAIGWVNITFFGLINLIATNIKVDKYIIATRNFCEARNVRQFPLINLCLAFRSNIKQISCLLITEMTKCHLVITIITIRLDLLSVVTISLWW